jgi:hypothetical protein
VAVETFQGGGWLDIRLDIKPNVKSDVAASITDMSMIEDKTVNHTKCASNFATPGTY